LLVVLLAATVVFGYESFGNSNAASLAWSTFQTDVATHQVQSVSINRSNGVIVGSLRDGTTFRTTGPLVLKPRQMDLLLKSSITTYKAGVPVFPGTFVLLLLSLMLATRLIWAEHRLRTIRLP